MAVAHDLRTGGGGIPGSSARQASLLRYTEIQMLLWVRQLTTIVLSSLACRIIASLHGDRWRGSVVGFQTPVFVSSYIDDDDDDDIHTHVLLSASSIIW